LEVHHTNRLVDFLVPEGAPSHLEGCTEVVRLIACTDEAVPAAERVATCHMEMVAEHHPFAEERTVVDSLVGVVHKHAVEVERVACTVAVADTCSCLELQMDDDEGVAGVGCLLYHPLEVAGAFLDMLVSDHVDHTDLANHENPCLDPGRNDHETYRGDTIRCGQNDYYPCHCGTVVHCHDPVVGIGRPFCGHRNELAAVEYPESAAVDMQRERLENNRKKYLFHLIAHHIPVASSPASLPLDHFLRACIDSVFP
jgi:hypothetical protein